MHVGHINPNVLSDLEKLIQGIYFPIITASEADSSETWKKDLLVVMQRFSNNMSHISQQLHKEVDFKLPSHIDCDKIITDGSSRVDADVLVTLKDVSEKWIVTIQQALEQEMKQVPLGNVTSTLR